MKPYYLGLAIAMIAGCQTAPDNSIISQMEANKGQTLVQLTQRYGEPAGKTQLANGNMDVGWFLPYEKELNHVQKAFALEPYYSSIDRGRDIYIPNSYRDIKYDYQRLTMHKMGEKKECLYNYRLAPQEDGWVVVDYQKPGRGCR